MEKKNFKVYEAPAVEVVEVEAQGVICASQIPGFPETGENPNDEC